MRRNLAGVALAGAVLVGGAGALLAFGSGTANAQSPSPTATTGTTASPSTGTTGTTQAPTTGTTDQNGTAPSTGTNGTAVTPCGPGGHGGLGPNHETVSDTSVAATAIGISESDLTTALAAGQSMADVAKAHNVDPQKVIDALVADENAEIAAAVTAGTMTQAQADTEKTEVVARITDRVNGTMPAGGPGGRGSDCGSNAAPQPAATPSA
jgi:cytoskeletal protein RodZ